MTKTPSEEATMPRSANAIDRHVASRVRIQRVALGMSQEQVGDKLGITFQQVQKYEKGVNRIGASRLFDLARVLGVSVQFFYEGVQAGEVNEADRLEADAISNFLTTGEGIELNSAFVRITDPKVRRKVVGLVSSIAGEPA